LRVIPFSAKSLYTSQELHGLIKRNSKESGREWLLAMMEKAGKENSNNCGFQLWRQQNQPIVLDNPTIMHQKLDYLHNNPCLPTGRL